MTNNLRISVLSALATLALLIAIGGVMEIIDHMKNQVAVIEVPSVSARIAFRDIKTGKIGAPYVVRSFEWKEDGTDGPLMHCTMWNRPGSGIGIECWEK